MEQAAGHAYYNLREDPANLDEILGAEVERTDKRRVAVSA